MAILRPLLGRLTQGCIFTCARAENYGGRAVYGFVITARCDVEQDKVPILNYLPVVTLDDWLARDGFDLLHSRLTKESDSAIRGVLKNCQIAASILDSHALRGVEAAFFLVPGAPKLIAAQAERFARLLSTREFLDEAAEDRRQSAERLFSLNERASSAILQELIEHRLGGHYFLPSVYEDGDENGYVILLREVRHIPRDVAQMVSNGLELRPGVPPPAHDGLSFDVDKFAMPIGELSSPAVEHVLQTFGHLFGRIGLEDPKRDYVEKIIARRPPCEGK